MCYIIKSKKGPVYVTSQGKQLTESIHRYLANHSITNFFMRAPGEPQSKAVAMSI